MTNVVIQQNSRKLLMMDILISETCWAHKKWNKIASDIKLVFYSSIITMMHGPINTRLFTEVWIPSTASLLDDFCRFIEGWTCSGDTGLWGYDAVSTGKGFLPFLRKAVPSSARVKSSQNMPWRKRHFVPFKQQLPPIDKVRYPRQFDCSETPPRTSNPTPHMLYVHAQCSRNT